MADTVGVGIAPHNPLGPWPGLPRCISTSPRPTS
jgi:hypothetical protein